MGAAEPGYVRDREPGFRPGRKVYKLVWDDGHDLAGLVVRARTVSTGVFLELTDMADRAKWGTDEAKEMMVRFAEVLVSWNLEDEDTGVPVPASFEGLLSQEFDLVMAVINQWMDAVAGVSGPLDPPASGGPLSPVASLPMEPLSPNPPNWPQPG